MSSNNSEKDWSIILRKIYKKLYLKDIQNWIFYMTFTMLHLGHMDKIKEIVLTMRNNFHFSTFRTN